MKIFQFMFLLSLFLPSTQAAKLTPLQEKDLLDDRVPLPLSPSMANQQLANMRELFEHVQILVDGMGQNDFKIIEKGAARFTTNAARVKMAKDMGRGDQAFAEMGILLLESGDSLMVAVKKKDLKLINQKFAELLSNCSACHGAYKQNIIPENDFLKIKPAVSRKARDIKLKRYVSQIR